MACAISQVFRSPRSGLRRSRQHCFAAFPTIAFGARSLRSGFVTSAARRDASIFKMPRVSQHKSTDVLQAYVRGAGVLRDHAGAGLL
jgi:hypothetical protein